MIAVEGLRHDLRALDLAERHAGTEGADGLGIRRADSFAFIRETHDRRFADDQPHVGRPNARVRHGLAHGIRREIGVRGRADLGGGERAAARAADGEGARARGPRARLVEIDEQIAERRHRALAAGGEEKGRALDQALAAALLDRGRCAVQRILARKIVDVRVAFGLHEQRQAPHARRIEALEMARELDRVAGMRGVIGDDFDRHFGFPPPTMRWTGSGVAQARCCTRSR